MKKLITIGYVAALLAFGVGFAKAESIEVTASIVTTPNSVELCNYGKAMFYEGAKLNEVIEVLRTSQINVEDKVILINCFIAEKDKV